MPHYLTDTAIVLRTTDFSETSQVVGLFTRIHGIIPAIAKGAKRQAKSSAFSGPLDLLTSGQVVFIPAKSAGEGGGGAAELANLTAWELADPRNGLRTRLAALNAALVAAEITLHLLHPHDPHPELYEELEAALQLMAAPPRPAANASQAPTNSTNLTNSTNSTNSPARTLVAYAKAALTAAGYAPQLDTCLTCNRPLATLAPEAPLRFSPRAGGILCETCPAPAGSTPQALLALPARIAIALARLPAPTTLRATPPNASITPARPADPAALAAALQILLAHIESITDKPLRTRQVLPTIFR